jgi:hypothetical protein
MSHLMAHASLGHPVMAVERAKGVGPEGLREILEAPDRKAGIERARAALGAVRDFPWEWESDADRLTLLYLSRIGFTSEGYPRSIEAFLPPAARSPGPYWEPLDHHGPPLDKRLSQVRAELASMGLDAGLSCEQAPYAPIRARLGGAP